MLLTAIAATVVIVSFVGHATRDRGTPDPPRPHGTQLAEQPLLGLGGGVTVRELTQDTPFSLVALTGDLAGTSTRVRATSPAGSWGPWYQTESGAAARGAGLARVGTIEGPRSTDPVFVGATRTGQIAVSRPVDAPVTQPLPAPP